ncbi:MAG: transposase [Desulfobacterales bacterium]|nr:transposase [Desulfobacterales bacterium]
MNDLQSGGLKIGLRLCSDDGVLGLWKAIAKAYPDSRWQRFRVHKTDNILDKLPKNFQSKAKQKIHEIRRADGKNEAKRPIEPTFAAVWLRAAEGRVCFSSTTVIPMSFKLCQCARKKWICLHHPECLPQVIIRSKIC